MGGWGGKRSGPAGSWFLNKSKDKQWIQRRTEGKCFHRRMYYVLTEQNYIPDVWACCCFMDGFLTHRGHWEVIGAQAATGNGFCSQVCSLLFFLPTATCAKTNKKKNSNMSQIMLKVSTKKQWQRFGWSGFGFDLIGCFASIKNRFTNEVQRRLDQDGFCGVAKFSGTPSPHVATLSSRVYR